jgi:hypothetical protein
LQVRRGARVALAVFQAVQVLLDDAAADAGDLGMLGQERQRLLQEAGHQLHVAVHQVDVLAAGVLVAQLRAGAAAAVGRARELHHLHRVAAGQFHRAIGRARVGQDHLAGRGAQGRQAALDGGADVGLLVQRLDDDGDAAGLGGGIMTTGPRAKRLRRCAGASVASCRPGATACTGPSAR